MVPLCREVSENIHGSPASTVGAKIGDDTFIWKALVFKVKAAWQ
jgi:hypothetical protein